ncbi:MAG: hypothetical protein AAB639_02830 [Patescibacteria group bacterium]
MELKVYLKVFKKYWPVVIILILFGAVLGYFYTRQLPTGFRATKTFFLAPAPAGQTNFEANNAQEMARNFTDTATAIIASSDFQSQITASGQTLTVRKNASQVLTISAHAPTGEEASALIVKSKELFNSRFGSPGATLKEIGPAQTPQAILGTPLIYALAGAILGFGFAIFTISLKTYFKL